MDADEGQNAVVYYSLPEDVPFIIDVNSGDIRTSSALDYEKQSVNKFNYIKVYYIKSSIYLYYFKVTFINPLYY